MKPVVDIKDCICKGTGRLAMHWDGEMTVPCPACAQRVRQRTRKAWAQLQRKLAAQEAR